MGDLEREKEDENSVTDPEIFGHGLANLGDTNRWFVNHKHISLSKASTGDGKRNKDMDWEFIVFRHSSFMNKERKRSRRLWVHAAHRFDLVQTLKVVRNDCSRNSSSKRTTASSLVRIVELAAFDCGLVGKLDAMEGQLSKK